MSTVDFDNFFYNGSTGESIPFKAIFPPGKYAIVGNSPITLEKKNGVNIDLHDYVIRFNNFQLVNYESYVGKKTNSWITGGGQQAPNNLPVCLDREIMKKVLVMNKNISFKEKQKRIQNKYQSYNLSSFVIFHNKTFLNSVTSLVQGVPTTGLLIILMLAAKYRNIDTYGFSFGSYKQRYHYYRDTVRQDYGHRWKNELILFQKIVRKKLVNNYDIINNFQSTINNNQNTFYKNLPKHIKRLYAQRKIRDSKSIKPQNNYQPRMYQNHVVSAPQINTRPIKNTHNPSVTEDTNNKIMEISKMLNNI